MIANGHWLGYIFGLLAGYAGGFVATYFFGIPKDRLAAVKEAGTETVVPQATAAENTNERSVQDTTTTFYAVANGQTKALTESSDPVFRQKMMGDGYFVLPENGAVYAPVSGTVTAVFPTKHAIGFTTSSGLEVLLHMGVDTVELKGMPFDVFVEVGQEVTSDTQVAQVDLAQLKAHQKAAEMLVLVTNMDAVSTLGMLKTGQTNAGEMVLNVK